NGAWGFRIDPPAAAASRPAICPSLALWQKKSLTGALKKPTPFHPHPGAKLAPSPFVCGPPVIFGGCLGRQHHHQHRPRYRNTR
ncbi:unnamed protein product, partial [Ectocarpus sp. 12 AP-2014]